MICNVNTYRYNSSAESLANETIRYSLYSVLNSKRQDIELLHTKPGRHTYLAVDVGKTSKDGSWPEQSTFSEDKLQR